MWASKTPKEAYDVLASPDVTVTNQKHKETQLKKLLALDREVREAMLQAEATRDDTGTGARTANQQVASVWASHDVQQLVTSLADSV